jgi:ABC-2 type transport system ATP-binding protein
LIHADAGSLRVLERDPWRDPTELHRHLAYVPGDVALWPNLTGGEMIDLLGRLRGGLDAGRRADLLERFALDPSKKGRTYSKGNRQKVALISALASDVDLYLLDEPTSGLDPLMEATFRECVAELRDKGHTVLLSSHILSEAEALSDRVSIIRDGRIVETGTMAELRHLTRTSVAARLERKPAGLEQMVGVHDLRQIGDLLSAQVDASSMAEFIGTLASFGVMSLESRPPTLEDLFLRHYSDDST